MSREIKFRAWHDGKMVYSKDFTDLTGGEYFPLSVFFNTIREDAIVEEFSGLKDRQGTDIYPGDVLTFDDDDPVYNYPCYMVQWDERGYYTGKGIDPVQNLFAHSFRLKDCKILGNIHANPEMLKYHERD